ncbi:MAG: hypothetical protein ABFD16_24685 [Thermoguttaceae bacterium]|jgi:hypothetical protein
MSTTGRFMRGSETLQQQAEDLVSGSIQKQIVKLPSDAFLWLAMGSIAGSLALQFMGKREQSLFVGQWAPTFVLLGVFDKLIKIAGTRE